MIKTLLFLFTLNIGIPALCQSDFEKIDRMVVDMPLRKNDWIIALNVDRPGLIPEYDSSGNQLSYDSNGTYIFSRIDKKCTLHFYGDSLTDDIEFVKFTRTITLNEDIICNYTSDSIQKAENEWMHPYIYKDDTMNTYHVQENGSHASVFRFRFRTQTISSISIIEVVQIQEFIHLVRNRKNLKLRA